MPLWIPITIAAAFCQNIRSSMQKHLKGVMGNTGATFVRFGFGFPVALFYWLILSYGAGLPVPGLNQHFGFWLLVAASAQIGGTFLLVSLFSFRNFVVGTAYSRTEAIQTAILAALLFGTTFSSGAVISILVTVAGVMLISLARSAATPLALLTNLASPTALIGIISGSFFALSAVGYREATLALEGDNFVMQACTTLVLGTGFQTLVMLIWMLWRDKAELGRISRAWKPALLVGLSGATASFGWFAAFALQEAAIVKVLAQVEIIFTFLSSYFFFKEQVNWKEVTGCLLIVAGIILLLLVG